MQAVWIAKGGKAFIDQVFLKTHYILLLPVMDEESSSEAIHPGQL
jgi:hypothetical protein